MMKKGFKNKKKDKLINALSLDLILNITAFFKE